MRKWHEKQRRSEHSHRNHGLQLPKQARGTAMLCTYAVPPCTHPMASPQGSEKLYGPIGFLKLCTRVIFLAVRWLENQMYLNETVAHTPKAEETQL